MLIGPVACTMASNLIENIIRKDVLTHPCQIMTPMIYMNYNTQNPKVPNMHHTNRSAQTTE